MTPFGLSGLLAGISSIVFGVFVYWKTQNKKLGQAWLVFTLAVAGWGFGAFWMGVSDNAVEGLLAGRMGYALGVIWIAASFYRFVCIFLGLERSKSISIHYLLALFFLLFTPSRLLFKRADLIWNSVFYARSGPLHYLFFIWWMGLVVYSHYLLLHSFRQASRVKKNQIKYFFLATAIGFSGGSLAYLPNFGIDLYPWGHFTACLYPVIMAYAIVKHHLMDINLVIRKTLIYSTVTAVLTAVYVMITTMVARALEGWVTSPSAFSSVTAACAMALLFHPLRMKIQRLLDRYFFREALDQALLREATSGFVHEIKRPLSHISLPAELGLKDLEDLKEGRRPAEEIVPRLEERLRYIIEQSVQVGNKIEAIRAVSATSAEPMETVDVRDVIERDVASAEDLLWRNRVAMQLELPKDLPPVRARMGQLEIVFGNLIKNAVEAMAQTDGNRERRIHIHAHPAGERLEVVVLDSGPGIKRELVPHLFEPYFTTKGARGMGMGLFLCRQIIQAHGGSISVRGEDHKGAEFIITLPAA